MVAVLLLIALSAGPQSRPAASQPVIPEATILRLLEKTMADAGRLDDFAPTGRSKQAEALYQKALSLIDRLPADHVGGIQIRKEIAERLAPPETREDKVYAAGDWQFRVTLAGWRARPYADHRKQVQLMAQSDHPLDDRAFVRIHVAMVNRGKTSQTLPALQLVDEEGAKYDPYWVNGRDYVGFEKFNPNQQQAGVYEWRVSFLRRYNLLVTDDGGQSVTVKLGELPDYIQRSKDPLDLRPKHDWEY